MRRRKNIRWMRLRLFGIAGLLLACACGLLYRIWSLQVSQAKWLGGLAQEQYLKEIALEPMRGAIVDRNGEPLAVSVMTDSVFAMPPELENPQEAARLLANLLEIDPGELKKKFTARRHFTWVKRRLPPKEAESVRQLQLPGIYFTRESRRYYPSRELAAAVVGFAGDGRGLEGIELMFDGRLRGSTVLAQGLKDARGNLLLAAGIGSQEFGSGGKLVLTIDRAIQEIVERELEIAVKQSGAKMGTAVVMEPFSGEILAMASVPLFNPNTYWRYAQQRFRNRAVTDCFEPGSTMKVFTMASALQKGEFSPGDTVDRQHGKLAVGGHVIHDSSSGRGAELLTLKDVLVQSSNVGIAKIGERLGKERLFDSLRRFGFGQRTGVDLPGESQCVLREPQRWSNVELATVSFGQGVSVTPLQLTAALCAVANGGVWMRPLIVKEIRGAREDLLQEFGPEPLGRVLDRRWARLLTEMMIGVTEPGGTGSRAAVSGFQVAGKTGTAQKVDPIAGGYSRDKRVASFLGFVPAQHPRIAVLVMVDEPTQSPYGGVVAAPAFARMSAAILRYLGVFPQTEVDLAMPAEALAEEDEAEMNFPAPKTAARDAGIYVPDLRGVSVRAALRALSGRGLEVTVIGSGRVTGQKPAPGTPLDRLTGVSLILEDREDRTFVETLGTEIASLERGGEE